jgi:hypothetical protein
MSGLFERAIRQMRGHDPQAREDGFHDLRPHAAEYLDELVGEFKQERDDHGLRCWLIELIGGARSPAAAPLLIEQLNGDDEALRAWAAWGLERLDTKEARHALWQAQQSGGQV